jgi:hypothetical protein
MAGLLHAAVYAALGCTSIAELVASGASQTLRIGSWVKVGGAAAHLKEERKEVLLVEGFTSAFSFAAMSGSVQV